MSLTWFRASKITWAFRLKCSKFCKYVKLQITACGLQYFGCFTKFSLLYLLAENMQFFISYLLGEISKFAMNTGYCNTTNLVHKDISNHCKDWSHTMRKGDCFWFAAWNGGIDPLHMTSNRASKGQIINDPRLLLHLLIV